MTRLIALTSCLLPLVATVAFAFHPTLDLHHHHHVSKFKLNSQSQSHLQSSSRTALFSRRVPLERQQQGRSHEATATQGALYSCSASNATIDILYSRPTLDYGDLQQQQQQQEALLNETLVLNTRVSQKAQGEVLRTAAATANAKKNEDAWELSDLQSVFTTALLVTGNTVGAGALVLPELVAKPGFAISTAMFTGAYLVNLMSGLILAEVAIKQHEADIADPNSDANAAPPSSFREFANVSLESPAAANGIAAVSLFVNTCALTFSLGRAGVILSDLLGGIVLTVDHVALSIGFAALLAVMGATQSRVRISQISSGFVAALFLSVAGLILPGLAQVQDPLGTLLAPGTSSPDVLQGMVEAAPIMLTTLIFQNIVPPVTRILGYDRSKSVAALLIGSFLPLVLYLSWSFVVLGGGVDTNVGIDSPLMTVFSVAAVTGSAIGCTMAVSEELQAFMPVQEVVVVPVVGGGTKDHTNQHEQSTKTATTPPATTDLIEQKEEEDNGYALPAVLAAVLVPLVCSTLCNEYTDALKLSGGYGIPVLYGAIPVLMLWTQRKKQQLVDQGGGDLIPGGNASLGLVAAAFGAFMMNSIVGDASHFVASAAV